MTTTVMAASAGDHERTENRSPAAGGGGVQNVGSFHGAAAAGS